MPIKIQFLGAAGTVTGSKYLLSSSTQTILVDCGLFQGAREWRVRNWEDPPFSCESIDAVLLTHAHIDHTGMLPRYHTFGLRCPVYATGATAELTQLLLIDSAKLQEEEAAHRARTGKSRHNPPLPLYTERDARGVLSQLKSIPFYKTQTILPGVKATWRRMGHILGAASITLEMEGTRVTFSGDIGRYNAPILTDPEPVELGDLLLVESTYGSRVHSAESPAAGLASVINETMQRRGVVVIPSFAVGRTQEILFHLRELKASGSIPDIPIIVDSPMADDATHIYAKHKDCYDESARAILVAGAKPFHPDKLYFVKDRSESVRLNSIEDPMIIISASGMLSGGRVLHHLKHRISSPRNTILFVGYQPPGGRGDWIKSGATSLTLFGEEVPIRASIEEISGLSAHGDREELLRWCRSCSGTPGTVAVVHGEFDSATAFSKTLSDELGWNSFVPDYGEALTVTPQS